MVRTKIQRHTDPVVVQQLWNSILYIRQQKQISNRDRIRRYMQRSHDLKFAETDKHLDNAVSDGLIGQYTAVGFKGCRVGLEQDGFRMPDIESDFEKGDHDWYCFECHKPGEVLLCSECWRVYHLGCTTQDTSGPTFVCQVCKVTKKKQRMKRKELNRLLGYTVNRLKEKTKELHKLFTREEEENFARFVYLPMDLNTMEQKVRERKYRYLEQFKADAQVIFHNVVICYTVDKQYAANLEHGGMAELVKIMVRDCAYDLDEIKQCKDCYNFSNAKPKDWFCQPCRPPHELVYAKQKGFSHWPAKVIKVTPQGYDVRFFGGWHQRAVIQESSVKPIDVNLKTLNIKKTSGFTKACEELRRHQVLLEQQKETLDTAADEEEDLDDDEEDEPPPPPPKPKKKKEKKKKIRIEEEDGFDLFEEPKPKAKKRKVEREVDDEYTEIKPIKRKKHRPKVEEQQDSISTSSVPDKPASTPEDVNLVTSSEDNYHPPRSITTTESSTQTSKKMTSANRHPHKSTQTDLEIASTNCNCEEKYTKIFSDLKSSLETTHEQDKEKALKELAERLQKDFEEDKQQAVSRAMSNVQREVDRTRRKAEERVKEQYMEEMKQLALKHKAEISTTKKKQWCYNCEEEAMYHCCWNTSYCSVKCQQEHWGKEHKRTCRRKR